jgi:hypothetical protein
MFELRCEARARLVAAGELTLHDAADSLQHDAEASGLIAELGQDEVQAIMAAAFANVGPDLELVAGAAESSSAEDAWNSPTWRQAAIDYHQARGDRVSIVGPHDLPARWDEMPIGEFSHRLNDPQRHGVAKSTLDAADYLLRENDPKRFEAWLLRHTPAERTAIIAYIDKRRGRP